LTVCGREELLDYIWATDAELVKDFTAKIVKEYERQQEK